MKKVKQSMISPYLTFKGNCSEAMNFYRECLGGELYLLAVKESPMADQWPSDVQDHILHASLQRGTMTLLGSDIAPSGGIVKGNAISLAFNCSTVEEIESAFNMLARGGQVTHPLHRFFDGTIGALTDRFGMNWVLKL